MQRLYNIGKLLIAKLYFKFCMLNIYLCIYLFGLERENKRDRAGAREQWGGKSKPPAEQETHG